MKLDHDLVRDILLAVEASDANPLGWITLNIEGRTQNELAYHTLLLKEAGFIEAQNLCRMGPDGFDWKPKRLTYTGHELLEAIRENEIWQQTKDAAKKGGVEAIGFLWEIGKALGKTELKKRTGIDF